MNSKKAKRIRKAINFDGAHPYDGSDQRTYVADNGQTRAKGMRGAYIAAKKAAKKAGLA